MSKPDYNDLAYWFPRIHDAGLPVPRTEIVRTEVELLALLDGETPEGWAGFLDALSAAVERIGRPCFLRTGHGSGKHDWRRTCYLAEGAPLGRHIAALVEWSALADMFGLPTETWVVRELIPTTPLCRCEGYGGMPVVREFRYFVDRGEVVHCQPYWPPAAVEQGRPDTAGWPELLLRASRLGIDEKGWLGHYARDAATAVGGGHWSIDFLQDAAGAWWLTDMALGDESFRYDPEAS